LPSAIGIKIKSMSERRRRRGKIDEKKTLQTSRCAQLSLLLLHAASFHLLDDFILRLDQQEESERGWKSLILSL
jgi:hypothetical protein